MSAGPTSRRPPRSPVLLTALGYQPRSTVLSVPVTYAVAQEQGHRRLPRQLDADDDRRHQAVHRRQSVERSAQNLEGAGYRLVVPNSLPTAGVKSFKDIGKFKDKFSGKIYGIEPGNDGNRIILDMIAKDDGLDGLRARGNLAKPACWRRPRKSMKSDEWIVFLGWTPHPVTGNMKIKYLDGMGRAGFRRRHGLHQCARGLHDRMPECRQVHREPQVRPADGKRDDGHDPQDGKDAQRGGRPNG